MHPLKASPRLERGGLSWSFLGVFFNRETGTIRRGKGEVPEFQREYKGTRIHGGMTAANACIAMGPASLITGTCCHFEDPPHTDGKDA